MFKPAHVIDKVLYSPISWQPQFSLGTEQKAGVKQAQVPKPLGTRPKMVSLPNTSPARATGSRPGDCPRQHVLSTSKEATLT